MEASELEKRFSYHPPTEEKAQAHANLRAQFKSLAVLIAGVVPEGREKELAFTNLEEAMMWSNAGIARN